MSRQEDLQKLIYNYGRRLQKLQEQQALMGLDTPPHILIEIEDVLAKIAELEAKLGDLEAVEATVTPGWYPTRPPSPPAQPTKTQPQLADGQTIFVGRQTQLAELERHWQEAYHQHRGKVVFLTGEAGIGKTSLVQQFSQVVLANYPNVQYASAACDQIAGDISPYAPFIQLLSGLTEQATQKGNHWAIEFAREIAPDVLQMVPVAGPLLAMAVKSVDFAWQRRSHPAAIESTDTASRCGQQDIFQQFTDTFYNIARKKSPLLLFVDDWHWADTSSTNLLFHLARQLGDVPILLLATYRPHDARVRQHPILTIRTEMERYSICADLSLDFFSRDDIIAYLIRRFSNGNFEQPFIDWLVDITNGNALFTTEYINLLLKEKLLTPNGQLTGTLEQVLPPANVEAVIRSRIGYLDREARDMLAYGSVEGEHFTTLVLSRLLDVKPLQLLKRLRAIEEVHQLIVSLGQQTVYQQPTTVYRFIHTLVHHSLHNILETEERVEINRMLLALREEVYVQANDVTKAKLAPELMAHAGEAGDYLAQARYAVIAAQYAAQRYAHAEVIRDCTIGLEALSKITDVTTEVGKLQIDLLLRRADTEDFTGEWLNALETYHQVESLIRVSEDGVKLVRVLNNIGWVLQGLGRFEEALNSYQQALLKAEQLDDQDSLARVYNTMGAIYVDQAKYDQALNFHQKAAQIWEKLGDKARAASAYQWIGGFYRNQGEYEQALAWFNRARTINEEINNRKELAWNYNGLGSICRNYKSYDQALAYYQKAMVIWQELGYIRGELITTNNFGLFYTEVGDYNQALEWFQKAISLNNKLGNKSGLAWSYRSLGSMYQRLGDQFQALDFYTRALTISEELAEKDGQATVLCKIGTVYEAQDNYQRALKVYEQALRLQEEIGNSKDIAETRDRIAVVRAQNDH